MSRDPAWADFNDIEGDGTIISRVDVHTAETVRLGRLILVCDGDGLCTLCRVIEFMDWDTEGEERYARVEILGPYYDMCGSA